MLAAGPFGLGPMELVIILLVLVMLFGATRLADLGGSLGKGIKEFRKQVKEEDGEEEAAEADASKPQATTSSAPAAVSSAPAATNGGATNSGATGSGAAETVSAVKCPTCGALNAVGSKHCNQCGAAIAAPVS
jgi:sec-independent protein translocase protein TatA